MLIRLLAIAALLLGSTVTFAESPTTRPTSPLEFTIDDINGKPVELSQYKGKVVMIVNTASKCGMTPQYEALQKLHTQYAERGLAILAFPCNDFKGQEPGTNEQIAEFCKTKYNVAFDLFSKVTVKGENQTPLFAWLISKETNPTFGGEIKWNFNKFLIGRDGQVVARFEPSVKPGAADVIKTIEAELKKPAK